MSDIRSDRNEDRQRLRRGIEEFNRQEFFQCHETLEALWQEQSEPERQFTQGIIQIAVGYYHLSNGNWAGAGKLFERGLKRLIAFSPEYHGLDIGGLANSVSRSLRLLESANLPAPESPPKIKVVQANSD